jgi:hypothetical protein|nr:MAG: hypothetical protein DIU61_07850 [Bacteroidota bacterium]
MDQLKKDWSAAHSGTAGTYDPATFTRIVRSRVKEHTRTAMQYFWASFVLQLIVYALLSHVIVRYWSDRTVVLPAILGIALFIPFTIVLMTKFKAIAAAGKTHDPAAGDASLKEYILLRRNMLLSFYRFKRWYEFILIPLASAIGVFIVFELYVPGGVAEHQSVALTILIITLTSCAWAIHRENQRNFKEPLARFDEVLKEFEREK